MASEQRPFAIMLCCANSRVAPEILFDQGLGDIFDNRVAGNIADDLLLGSIEYSVEHFGSPLLMVLGHGKCGAITATIESIETGKRPPAHIDAIVGALIPIVEPVLRQPGNKVDNAVTANIRAQVRQIMDRSDIVRQAVQRNELMVVGARYDLENGEVALLR